MLSVINSFVNQLSVPEDKASVSGIYCPNFPTSEIKMPEQLQIEVKPQIATSMLAQEEYHNLGSVQTARCERCHDVISICRLGQSALKMSCKCGMYDDTLRGI